MAWLAAEKTPLPCHRGEGGTIWLGGRGGVGVPAHIYIIYIIYIYIYTSFTQLGGFHSHGDTPASWLIESLPKKKHDLGVPYLQYQWPCQMPKSEVLTTNSKPVAEAYVREYPHKIYMV